MGVQAGSRFTFFLKKRTPEYIKLLLMSLTFLFVIAAYTIVKELKDSIFVAIVGGREYIPPAKIISIFVLVPLILIYSNLVDHLKRYRLFSFYCFFYGFVGLIFAFFLGHATIGLDNTNASPYRLFGWLFYFFIEGYSPFVISLFWSFLNSITSPESAKKNYWVLVSSSKVGGIVSASFAWLLLNFQGGYGISLLSGALKHQILLIVASMLLVIAPLFIYLLIKIVSSQYLHGYEVVYKLEKKQRSEGRSKTGILSGIRILLRNPYAFGIFFWGMCYELIYSVLSYQRISIAQAGGARTTDVTSYFFQLTLMTHFVGLFISVLGTRQLLKHLSERQCLILNPLITALLLIYFKISGTHFSFLVLFVVSRALYWGFGVPVRESLYIPTVKELKFKTKSWIDAFGTKFSKSNGHLFNLLTSKLSVESFAIVHSIFFTATIGLWCVTSWLLGTRYEQAIKRKEAIGLDGLT